MSNWDIVFYGLEAVKVILLLSAGAAFEENHFWKGLRLVVIYFILFFIQYKLDEYMDV